MDKQKRLQGMTLRDIAKKTGIPYSSIRKFSAGLYDGDNERIANAVARALGIER